MDLRHRADQALPAVFTKVSQKYPSRSDPMALEGLLLVTLGQMRIPQSHLDGLVPEQLLHRHQVDPTHHQVVGKGVAKIVGMDCSFPLRPVFVHRKVTVFVAS